MDNYTYRAEWSYEDLAYVARCLEFPQLFGDGPTAVRAIESVQRKVAENVAEYEADGGTPPPSLSDRRYSGKFVVRTSPQLHAKLVIEAAEQGVSLNHWAVEKLAGRMPSLDDIF